MKRIGLYEASLLAFLLLLPLGATAIEWTLRREALFGLAWKWFVFSGVGLRLGSAGIRQILDPEFTAHRIFDARGRGAPVLVRELGFANLLCGVLGAVSLVRADFRLPATVAGGGFFLLAGLQHAAQRGKTGRERLAMLGDLFIALALAFTAFAALRP